MQILVQILCCEYKIWGEVLDVGRTGEDKVVTQGVLVPEYMLTYGY
jgi:hypothetical protein